MARKRKPKQVPPTVSDTDGAEPIKAKKGSVIVGLTAEQIQTLLGKTRQKGIYVLKLNEFLNSDEAAISVKETWVEFRDKKDTTLKQGFDNAKDNKEAQDGAEHVKVISNEGDVFLVNIPKAAEAIGDESLVPAEA